MADEAMSAWVPEDRGDEPAETVEQRAERLGWRCKFKDDHGEEWRRGGHVLNWSPWRGWTHLTERIRDDGVREIRPGGIYFAFAAALDAIHGEEDEDHDAA